MKKITIFGDIHANLPALEAVFTDMAARRSLITFTVWEIWWATAHSPTKSLTPSANATSPPSLATTIRVSGRIVMTAVGAYRTPEEALGVRSIPWSNAHTTTENKAYLRQLVDKIPVQLGDLKVVLVHGSPRKVNEYLYEDWPEASLERLLDMVEADVGMRPYPSALPSGAGQRPSRHQRRKRGQTKGHDLRACYLVLSAEGKELSVEFIRVAYDVEKAVQAIEATEMPNEFAEMLRQGKG